MKRRFLQFAVPVAAAIVLAVTFLWPARHGSSVALADAMVGGSRHVSGDVSFTPKAGGEYRVKGILEKNAETVWLVDEKTGEVTDNAVKDIIKLQLAAFAKFIARVRV